MNSQLRVSALVYVILLGLVQTSAPVSSQAEAEFQYDDPRGDVRAQTEAGDLGLPSAGITDLSDIVSVYVARENRTHFTMGLKLGGMDTAMREQARGFFGGTLYRVDFILTGLVGIQWNVLYHDFAFNPENTYELCKDGGSRQSECKELVGLLIDESTASVLFVIPKDELVVEVAGTFESIHPGDQMDELVATTFLAYWGDRAPDAGSEGPYVFTLPTANGDLSLEWVLPEDEGAPGASEPSDALGVTPGVPSLVSMKLSNRLMERKTVALAGSLTGNSNGWTIVLPPLVTVPGNGSIVANALVAAGPGTPHREYVRLSVSAAAVAEPNLVAFAEQLLVATVTPTPQNNILQFHFDQVDCYGGVTESLNGACAEFSPAGFYRLNTVRNDPLYEDRDIALLGAEGGTSSAHFRADTPLGADLRFALEKSVIAVDLGLRSNSAAQVKIDVHLVIGDLTVGSGSTTAMLDRSTRQVHLEFAPALRDELVEAHSGPLLFVVELEESKTPVGGVPEVLGPIQSAADNVYLVVRESRIALPLLPLPPKTLEVGSGSYLVYVELAPGQVAEKMVNPGRSTLFNLTISNGGILADEVEVKPVIFRGTDNWAFKLIPARKFHLKPGESVNVTLQIQAPAAAKENEQAIVEIWAKSLNDPAARASIRLSVATTRGLEIPSETVVIAKSRNNETSDVPATLASLALLLAVMIPCRGLAARRPVPHRKLLKRKER